MNLCANCISAAYMDACVSGFIEVVASFQPFWGAAFTHFFFFLAGSFWFTLPPCWSHCRLRYLNLFLYIVVFTNFENSFCVASHFVDAKSNNLTDVRPTQLVQSFGCTTIGGANYLLSDNDGDQPKVCPIEGPWSAIAIWYYVLMWKSLKIAQMMACDLDSLLLLYLMLLSSGPCLLQFSGDLGFLFSVMWRWDITTCLGWQGKSRYVFWIIFSDLKTQLSWILRLHECVANVLP
jgi:hypothetical protein